MRFHIPVAVITATLLSTGVLAEEKTFSSNGVTIAYLEEGKGEAVVLLHGFGGSATETWTKLPFAKTQFLPALKDYRVIAPDLRGHGKCDMPHEPKVYGKEMAEDVVRLLDHLKVNKAHVVGYSMGALVAGKLLVAHPDRLLSVTFGGGGPLFQPPKDFTGAIDAAAESLEKRKGIGSLFIALAPDGQPKPSPEQAEAFSALFLADKDQMALAAVLRGLSGLAVTEAELKANKLPVRFVYGSRETFMKDLIAGASEVLPNAEVKIVENGDHGSTLAAPEFREEVLEFLRANKE